jgi:hypothetical protein
MRLERGCVPLLAYLKSIRRFFMGDGLLHDYCWRGIRLTEPVPRKEADCD